MTPVRYFSLVTLFVLTVLAISLVAWVGAVALCVKVARAWGWV